MKINQLKAGVILSYLYVFMQTIILLFYTPIMLRLEKDLIRKPLKKLCALGGIYDR